MRIMHSPAIYIFVVYFFACINKVLCIHNPPQDNPVRNVGVNTEQTALQPEGIFQIFIRNYIYTLINFPEKRLLHYCAVLSHHLKDIKYSWTKKFARHIKKLSRMDGEIVKQKLIDFQDDLDGKSRHWTKFLKSMNGAFRTINNLHLNDYLLDLRDYGSKVKIVIDKETRNLLHNTIIGNVEKLSRKKKREIEKNLKKAVEDYEDMLGSSLSSFISSSSSSDY